MEHARPSPFTVRSSDGVRILAIHFQSDSAFVNAAGQNIQGRHAELRADSDLEINIKAEGEIEVILHHLEYQNALLIAMAEKLGISVEKPIGLTSQAVIVPTEHNGNVSFGMD